MRRLSSILLLAITCFRVHAQGASDSAAVESNRDSIGIFQHFTVTMNGNDAQLLWSVHPVQKDDYFIVERSSDGTSFETVSAISATESDTVYRLTDNATGNLTGAYRLKYLSKDGRTFYSKVIPVASAVSADFRFYPNPVDKLLIIRSAHALSIQVQDAYGTVWYTGNVDAGMQIVNVSTLPKGSYILKAADRETSAVTSEQLLKN